jgi:acylphosphatase
MPARFHVSCQDGLPLIRSVPSLRPIFSIIMTARQVFYTGRVQGVGFRYTTKQVAAGYEVAGWVRNLPDGRVELLAAARDSAELDAFLNDLQENSAVAHYIKETHTHPVVPAPTDLRGFRIIS